MNKVKTLTEIQNETGLSKTIIKSLLVDYGIPNVQLGDNKDSLILVDEEQFKKVFTNVNVELSLGCKYVSECVGEITKVQ